MKRTLLIILVIFLKTNASFGQDVISLKNGKTINCTITNVDSSKIDMILKNDYNEINTSINISEVAFYKKGGKRYYPKNKEVFENLYSSNDKRSSKNAINIGFIGLQTVSVSLSYEHLLKAKHGLVLGLPILNTDKGKEQGFNLSYRNHFQNTMSSGYWGLFLSYSKIESQANATGYEKDYYKFSNTALLFGPNVGKRWILDPAGINLSIRIGYGLPLIKQFEWIDVPEDEEMEKSAKAMMKVVSGFDAELSIGYCF